MNNESVEILAPAGNRASLYAAIQGGADAVYFGLGQLNMRARGASNFDLSELPEIVSICMNRGVRSYLTLNTVMYNRDLPIAMDLIRQARECGVSAVIAADHAVMQFAQKEGIPLHISTQANISNIEAVEFYSSYADVMVLARELTLEQVAEICSLIRERDIRGPSGELVKIEIFVHGALCMAISGKCYLSLHAYNSSANRGECRQNCRHSYTVTSDGGNQLRVDNEYIMSPKDLCTIEFMDLIIRSGARVFKIEGRGRSPEYVKTVTKCYKEAADAVIKGTCSPDKIKNWKELLDGVYNRGFWDGYYLGRKMGEWSERHGSASTKQKIYTGDVLHYYPKAGVAHLRVKSNQIKINDSLLIIGETTGVVETVATSLWVDEAPSASAGKGEECTIKLSEKVRPGDAVYIWRDRPT
ncbi:MAG: U32 family peptidase [Balneolaceae bacterium]|nr:MAG: U32 family peptidase [Balneolaceae bacterium]